LAAQRAVIRGAGLGAAAAVKEDSSFLKKRSKKLLSRDDAVPKSRVVRHPWTKSRFASLSSEKEDPALKLQSRIHANRQRP
jgi:hypothetical protein